MSPREQEVVKSNEKVLQEFVKYSYYLALHNKGVFNVSIASTRIAYTLMTRHVEESGTIPLAVDFMRYSKITRLLKILKDIVNDTSTARVSTKR